MARLKLNYWDAVVADCRDALALNAANMKASYYLAQALVSLQDFDGAITAAMRAHGLCIETGDRSLAAVTALVLRCKKERWEHNEKRRKREDQYLEVDVVETMEREKERALAATESEGERGDVAAEWDAKITDIRRVFETARAKGEQRREVPDWLIDDITFNVFVDPWVVSAAPDAPSFFLPLLPRLLVLTNRACRPRRANPTREHPSWSTCAAIRVTPSRGSRFSSPSCARTWH